MFGLRLWAVKNYQKRALGVLASGEERGGRGAGRRRGNALGGLDGDQVGQHGRGVYGNLDSA